MDPRRGTIVVKQACCQALQHSMSEGCDRGLPDACQKPSPGFPLVL